MLDQSFLALLANGPNYSTTNVSIKILKYLFAVIRSLVSDELPVPFKFNWDWQPKIGDLIKKLHLISKDPGIFHLCYEAGYLGFTLARELRTKGYTHGVRLTGFLRFRKN